MSGNGKIFISHAYPDIEACQPLLAALASWDVDYWFQTERAEVDETLAPQVEQEIAARDIFLRVLSRDAQASYWVRLETQTFLRLRRDEEQAEPLLDAPTMAEDAVAEYDTDRETAPELPNETTGAEDTGLPFTAQGDVRNDPDHKDVDLDDVTENAPAQETADLASKRILIDLSLDGTLADADGDESASADDISIDMTKGRGLIWRAQLRRALGLGEPESETGEVPAVTGTSMSEALRLVLSGRQTQTALSPVDDKVVSVAIADREADASAAKTRAVCLVVVQGNNVGSIYPLVSSRTTLGRRHDNDVILSDMAVSRQHAALIRDAEGRYVLHDEGSKNGTFVNGEPITERALQDGDTIRCGPIVLQFRLPRTHD